MADAHAARTDVDLIVRSVNLIPTLLMTLDQAIAMVERYLRPERWDPDPDHQLWEALRIARAIVAGS